MTLKLYYHPFSSFCQKVLIALYENGTAFEPMLVDLGDPESEAAFRAVWPIRKFPVLRDEAADRTIPETSVIIEYLDRHHPGRTRFIPADDSAIEVHLWDRFFDQYVSLQVTKIVTDRIRPADARDPHGVTEAETMMRTAYRLADERMAGRAWAAGDSLTLADCAAAPALFYANLLLPFAETHQHLGAYFRRLLNLPSFQRAVEGAKPYRHFFPIEVDWSRNEPR
jgi:glutathione S-transferase